MTLVRLIQIIFVEKFHEYIGYLYLYSDMSINPQHDYSISWYIYMYSERYFYHQTNICIWEIVIGWQVALQVLWKLFYYNLPFSFNFKIILIICNCVNLFLYPGSSIVFVHFCFVLSAFEISYQIFKHLHLLSLKRCLIIYINIWFHLICTSLE